MIINESWYQKPEGIAQRISAGGIIVRQEKDKVLISLARDKGQPDYILPKGQVDSGESILEAAKREIEEEAGFSELHVLAELATLERLNFAKTHWICTHYFLFLTRQIDVEPTETKRHAVPHWFDIYELPKIFWPEQQRLVEDKRDLIVQTLLGIDQAILS